MKKLEKASDIMTRIEISFSVAELFVSSVELISVNKLANRSISIITTTTPVNGIPNIITNNKQMITN